MRDVFAPLAGLIYAELPMESLDLYTQLRILRHTRLFVVSAGSSQNFFNLFLPRGSSVVALPMCMTITEGCIAEVFSHAGLPPDAAVRWDYTVDLKDDDFVNTLARQNDDEALHQRGFDYPVDIHRLHGLMANAT